MKAVYFYYFLLGVAVLRIRNQLSIIGTGPLNQLISMHLPQHHRRRDGQLFVSFLCFHLLHHTACIVAVVVVVLVEVVVRFVVEVVVVMVMAVAVAVVVFLFLFSSLLFCFCCRCFCCRRRRRCCRCSCSSCGCGCGCGCCGGRRRGHRGRCRHRF